MKKLTPLFLLIILGSCQGKHYSDKGKHISTINDGGNLTSISFETCNHGLLTFPCPVNINYSNGWYDIIYETYPINNLLYASFEPDTLCHG